MEKYRTCTQKNLNKSKDKSNRSTFKLNLILNSFMETSLGNNNNNNKLRVYYKSFIKFYILSSLSTIKTIFDKTQSHTNICEWTNEVLN